MPEQVTHRRMRRAIKAARAGLVIQVALETFTRMAAWVLAPAIVLAAADQYWLDGRWSPVLLAAVLIAVCAGPLAWAALRVAAPFRAALSIDERTHLKDRLSSAWEFLNEGALDDARRTQVADALAHAEMLHARNVLNFAALRHCRVPVALAALFCLSFLVPARGTTPPDGVAAATRAAQLELLREMRESFEEEAPEEEELAKVMEKLREIEAMFEEGSLNERDLMIELARLEEELEKSMADPGVAGLARELDAVSPYLAADAASRAVGEALQRKELKKASEAMKALAEKAREGALSKEDKMNLASAMQAASKAVANSAGSGGRGKSGGRFMEDGEQDGGRQDQGNKNSNSFEGDLAKGAEALRVSDQEGFENASKSMSDKMARLQKLFDSQSMREQLSMCRAGLGQCEGGSKPGNGGLKAGSAPAGDNRGDRTGLEDSASELLKIAGMAGEGTVRTETETTAGETAPAGRTAKEVHSEYSAVAEEAIERENVPLSHRLHVKRYFQEIRPKE